MTEQYEERLMDGRVLLSTRNGIFQVRLYNGNRKYIYRSLKTRDLREARERAVRAYYELEFRKEQNLPVQTRRFEAVIDEYERFRREQYERGTYRHSNKANQQQTSEQMLRQIVRVSKFWREYAGKRGIESIDDKVLRDYVPWRRDYYVRIPADKRPQNAKLNPADKTLEWETTFALTLLKYATERGYRGNLSMPKYRYKAQRNRTRPPFTVEDYVTLYKGMRRWMYEERDNREWRYTRELLRDYVLILANSGMRVGEANNLRESDLVEIKDDNDRTLYGFNVDGKTGKRFVVLRANAKRYVDRTLKRNSAWREQWQANRAAGVKNAARKTAKHDDWFFRMADGNKVISLIDQFNKVLEREGITHNAAGERYTLYSLRHFYAVQMISRSRADVFAIARNMGTSVQIIQDYYGKHATSRVLATSLGG